MFTPMVAKHKLILATPESQTVKNCLVLSLNIAKSFGWTAKEQYKYLLAISAACCNKHMLIPNVFSSL